MNAWQRRVRVALAVFVGVFAISLFFALRHRPPPPQAPPVRRADPAAAIESSKGVAVQLKGDKEQLKVEFEDTLIYPNGTQRLRGVKVNVAERGGRSFVLTGREGDVGADESTVKVTGDVTLRASDGLTMSTEEAVYTQTDGIVRAQGSVQFQRGRMHGSGTGLTYDQKLDRLDLLDHVVADIAADEQGSGGAHIEAGSATLERPEHQWRFSRGVRVLRAGRSLEAENAVAHMSDDDAQVQRIELAGGSRIVGGSGSPGSLEAMSSRDMDLSYTGEGGRLREAILSGDAAVQVTGSQGVRGRRIAAQWMSIGLAPDGTTVTSLTGRNDVRLDLPPEDGVPARVVRSAALEASGTPATGITNAVFTDSVEFRETPAGRSAPRVAYAGKLTLALKPGFGAAESARFSGGTRFEDGDLRATARDALYGVTASQLELTGNDERTSRPPQVVEPKVTISGTRVEVGLETRRVVAQGAVDSVLQPAPKPAAPAPLPSGKPGGSAPAASEEHRPALIDSSQPAYVTSDRLVYEGATGLAVYTGRAHLWQGETTIVGDRLTLDDSKGDLTANGSVRSNLLLSQMDEKTNVVEKVPSKGVAESMVYTDEMRRITFLRGPAAAATLTGPQGDLAADRIDVYLATAGSEVDRLEADGGVVLKLPERRTGAGRHLLYTAVDGRYVMRGAPVQVQEQLEDGCRITTGTTLTFFKSTDRIVADGNQERRTETKNGGRCAGPGLD